MTILIAGAGTAGLTLARSLARQGRRFMVFDAESGAGRLHDRGLGLWGRSQAALRALGLSELLDNSERTLRIPAAAYRSRSGDWLSASSDTAANRVRVATLLESELLRALEDGLPPGSVRRGTTLVGAETGASGVTLTFADGSRAEGSCLVGADGVSSTVRRLLGFGGGGGAGSSSGAAVDTGYVSHSGLLLPSSGAPPSLGGSVHRGGSSDGEGVEEGGEAALASALLRNAAPVVDATTTSAGATTSAGVSTYYTAPATATAVDAHAFETLSRGRRFAMVPLARGGAFWFATRRVGAGEAGEGTSGPALRLLREAYDGWHPPIPRVLHFAACKAAEVAMGGGQAALASAAGAPRWERVWAAPTLPSWRVPRAVLLGDAAHGMPINLAQGAACGIEGAYLLGEAFGQLRGGGRESGGGSGSRVVVDGDAGAGAGGGGTVCESGGGAEGDDTPPSEAELAAAFATYEAQHRPRVRQCRAMTSFTDLLAMPATPLAEAARDGMRFVPPPLNGMIFDAALSLSLGDAPPSTRARWPLDIAA